MLNDFWFWIQLWVALTGFAAVTLYGVYFALKRDKRLHLSAFAERLFLNTVVAIPLGAAWYVLPFLPQPSIAWVSQVGMSELLSAAIPPQGRPFSPEFFGMADWMRIGAGLVVLVGSLFFMVRFARQNIRVTFDDYAKPKELLINGVYKRVRHPGILTQFFAAAAIAALSGGFYTLLLLPLHIVALYYSAVFEERYVLIPLFGKQFEQYRETTPAFYCGLSVAACLLLALACGLAWVLPYTPLHI